VNKDKTHLTNIGSFIEDMEIKMRTTLNTIYFGKTKDIVGDLRKKQGVAFANQQKNAQQLLANDSAAKKS
jgi:capping protein beta